MNKVIAWLLGQQPGTRDNPRLVDLERQRDEADVARVEAREYRTNAERVGPELRHRIRKNHFGEGIREALHQRGWTQT